MPEVIALTYFEHGRTTRYRGQRFHLSDVAAKDLAERRLVEVVLARPRKAAGKKRSASPAAPASKKQTASKSASGKRRTRKTGASSSRTPASE